MGNCGSMMVLGMGDLIRFYPTRTLGERNRQWRPSPLDGQPRDELLGARAFVVAGVHELDRPVHEIEDRDVRGRSTCSVPRPGTRLMIFAASQIARAATSSRGMPGFRNFDMTLGSTG